jgi:Zn-dependent protease with chaperone function
MRRVPFGLISILLSMLGIGCAATPSASTWISSHGGLAPSTDFRQARVNLVSQRLIASCTGRHISVQILATESVTAFSLWDGHLFVTRGLMDHLDDTELQAVIAHELGHLLNDGHLHTLQCLRGCCCVDPDCEIRADATGAALLRSQNIYPRVMADMLGKVKKFGCLSPSCAVAVDRRISILLADASNR